jgi:nicotinate-nucleotide adenylyltransferase
MRIGIFGGTFDPPHNGHVALAEAALEHLKLDEIIWVPAFRNPLKEGHPGASTKERFEMVQLAISDNPKLAISDIEIRRRGPSYMVDTLAELREVAPGDYWLLLGLDAALEIPRWKSYIRLLKMARIGCVLRAAHDWSLEMERLVPEVQTQLDTIPMKTSEISSSDIRIRCRDKRTIHALVPGKVEEFIKKHGLYGAK